MQLLIFIIWHALNISKWTMPIFAIINRSSTVQIDKGKKILPLGSIIKRLLCIISTKRIKKIKYLLLQFTECSGKCSNVNVCYKFVNAKFANYTQALSTII